MDAVQAVEVNSIMLATMAGAMVVLAGALYALVYAIGKLAHSVSLVRLSYLFYAFLVVSVLILARTLNFSGIWNWVAAVMLAGYLLAPQGIWKLCVNTHLDEKLLGKDAPDSGSDVTDTTDSSPRSVS